MIQINSVPYHGGLSEELYFSDDDRGDEPDHDQLGDDPLPLDVLLLALLLERVAVDVLPPGLVVSLLVTPALLPPRSRIYFSYVVYDVRLVFLGSAFIFIFIYETEY